MKWPMVHAARAAVLAVLAAGAAAAASAGAPPKALYLTFDADMTPGMLKRLQSGAVASWYDPAIVDFLRESRVPAAVFVTGLFAEANPTLIAGLAHDPLFVVGVHGYGHAAFTRRCYGLPVLRTDAEKRADIARARDAIARLTGTPPRLFRYPGLCHDRHDDELVREAGLAVDTPSIVSGDPFNRNVDAIVRQVLKRATPGGTVVFHLGGPNAPSTLDALRKLVPELRKRGYELAMK
jgi:peptidoglycan/xylan/chitin deacetylase (PgdA/CDA1 family)